MHYYEYLNKYKNIDKDVLICACINALEGSKDINIQDYIDEVLIQKQEYEDGLAVMNKLTEEYKNNYSNTRIKISNINKYSNAEGNFYYDASTNKTYIIYNGIPCEITNLIN